VTAITLNLLAEEQLAEQASARDPFKTAVAIGIAIITLVVMSGSILYVIAGQTKTEAGALQARLDTLLSSEAAAGEPDFRSIKALADDIIALNHTRPLYAHQLALIKDLMPESIQLSHITFTLSVDVQTEARAEAGGEENTTKERPRRTVAPKTSTHLILQMTGEAVSNRPELEVDTFMQILRNDAAFNERVKQIQLLSIARPPASAGSERGAKLSTQFIIECQYKESK
jgi:hypothetical protein